MSSSERATAARTAADPTGREAGRGLAGLIDVLDRADGGSMHPRSRPRRPATYRPTGPRAGGVRTVPLRSVQPAPMARPVLGVVRAPEARALPTPARGHLHTLIQRAALWGAGPQGEHLAWRSAQPTAHPGAPVGARTRVHRPARLRSLVRRVALWGSGPGGKYLAWGMPIQDGAAAKPAADRPVVLREMPSTPVIQNPPVRAPQVQAPPIPPVATSPAAALPPHGPASTGSRWKPPVPRGAVAVPGVRPSGRPERSPATGWPPQAPGSGVPTGLVRARGDPLSYPARGSPVPARRSRSPGSFRSSFP
jgi:hypothetical protein